MGVIEELQLRDGEIAGIRLRVRRRRKLRLPRGREVEPPSFELISLLKLLRAREFSGAVRGEKYEILLIEGRLAGANCGELSGEEALELVLREKPPGLKLYQFDELDLMLLEQLNLHRLKEQGSLEEVFRRFSEKRDEDRQSSLSREELLRKYRIKEPDEGEIEDYLRREGFLVAEKSPGQ